jgi:glycosyltransferase involved in cell wall biosynthesis
MTEPAEHPDAGTLDVLVFPRDGNPYQARLYEALAAVGVRSRYVGCRSRSHSLNLLLMPAEMLFWSRRGARILHIHWVFAFEFPGSQHSRFRRRLSYLWYLVVLWSAHRCRLRVVWTIHNVLPHQRVFPDDVGARRRLLRAASLVIAHSQQALDDLERVVEAPRHAIVAPHPRFHEGEAPSRRRALPRRVLMFGRISAYKGVEETIDAFESVVSTTTVELTITGECADSELRRRLEDLAARRPERVHLHLEHVPDEELASLFAAHDVQWLPYRRSTTSGAAIMGAQMGMALAISDLPSFAEVPGLRLGQDTAALAAALSEIDGMSPERLEELSAASARWAAQQGSWSDMAHATSRAMAAILTPPRPLT